MAIPTDRDLTQLGPFPRGANNLAEETSVPRGAFRSGVNVDVADSGKVRRRSGYTKTHDADEPHSLFGYGARGFFADGTKLYGFEVIDGAETGLLELYGGLRADEPLAHCLIEPDIYVSDGTTALRVSPTNAVGYWSLPPALTPTVTAQPDGSLAAGRYHVAIAYKASSGEEGPLSLTAVAELTDAGKLRIEFAPPDGTLRTAVYMTKPNGTELLLLAVVPAGTTVVTANKQAMGRPPVSEDMDSMPPGRFAAVWQGRLLVAADRFVYWSEPHQYGLTKLAYDYLEFIEPVTGLGAVETSQGYFVGQSSRTYFVAGENPADARLVEAYPFGIIAGTMTMVPGARLPFEQPPAVPVPMWMASNGVFCVGMPDGTVAPLTETKFAARLGSEGAAFFDQREGLNRYVATIRDPSENRFAFSDQVTAEVVRNGIPQT